MTSRHTEADARIAIDDRLRRAGRDPFDKSMVGAEVHAAEIPAADAVVDRSRARPFETHAPVYDTDECHRCLLTNRGIATGRVRLDDLFESPLSILDAAGKGIELFGEGGSGRSSTT